MARVYVCAALRTADNICMLMLMGSRHMTVLLMCVVQWPSGQVCAAPLTLYLLTKTSLQ